MVKRLQWKDTNINHFIRPTTGKSIHGSESEFSLTSASNKVAVVNSENVHFNSPKAVMSAINETNEMSGQKSFWLNLQLTTSNTKVLEVSRGRLQAVFCVRPCPE